VYVDQRELEELRRNAAEKDEALARQRYLDVFGALYHINNHNMYHIFYRITYHNISHGRYWSVVYSRAHSITIIAAYCYAPIRDLPVRKY
jgi:hypothetical protein